jgi:hypothetical protein
MMTSRARQEVPAWPIDSSLVTIVGLLPKDPPDDEDDEDEEPAVVREPDEC